MGLGFSSNSKSIICEVSNLDIPHDIVYCVLAKLSVKDLMKLKCLSKLWMNTIRSPEFVKLHFINHSFDYKSQKLICANMQLENYNFFYGSVSGFLPFPQMFREDHKSKSVEKIQCSGLFSEKNNVLGTSRGILLYVQYNSGRGRGVYLCNPWIRECRRIPPCRLESFPKQREWLYNVYGLGYDEVNDDFKVVKLVGIRSKTQPVTYTNEGKIYSLKSNKWKSIENIHYSIEKGKSGFLFNHCLHWIFRFHRESFLSVDIITGKHTLLPLPDDLRIIDLKNLKLGDLGEYNGCLCISKGTENGFVIWLMKDYGVKDSWTKFEVFVCARSFCHSRLIRYTKNENEEYLVFSTLAGVVYLFDFHDQKLYSRENIAAKNYFLVMESLVPLSHTDKSGKITSRSLYKRKRS